MHNQKNILFIIPEMSMGGAQRSLAKISDALAANYTTHVVVFNKDHVIGNAYQRDVLSLDVASGPGVFTKIKAFVTRVVRLKKLKKKLKIDVSVSFLEGADYVNILSATQDKIIISIRGSKVHDENMVRSRFWLRKVLIRHLYRKADAIVCVNKGIAGEMKEFYGLKEVPCHVVYNFYDISSIQSQADQSLSKPVLDLYKGQTLVMSGRLAREKGVLFIVKLFSVLKKQRVNLKLILVGDGPERIALRELAESLGLVVAYTEEELLSTPNPHIFITGDQRNVFKFLKHGTVYILNSSSEGFPNGLAEAMICGLPVVSSDCPYGPREILSDSSELNFSVDAEFLDYGVLLPIGNDISNQTIFNAWLTTILQLLDSDSLRTRYSQKGLQRMQEFSPVNMLNSWYRIIEA